MNTLLLVGLILLGCVPGALISLWALFGKSVVFRISSASVFILFLFGFLMFYAGTTSVKHLYWCIPAIALLFVGSLLVIKNTIGKNFKETLKLVKSITEGDLNVDIKGSTSNDELGAITSSLLQLKEALFKIITEVNANAGNLVSSSQQMSRASEQLSQGANEQASSIEEVSSTLEEISANTKQNSENARETAKVSVEASKSFIEVLGKAKGANEANQNIANKITIINDIAFQTNLLALNAAVEAARAGDYGKGFAVVAAEVRKLAENSKTAAEQIVTMSQNSLVMGKTAGELMMKTMPLLENTVKLVNEISAASIEQDSGVSQVNNAIQQLNNVTQQNASASEELATNAEQLAAQAEQLKETISFFKVGKNSGPAAGMRKSVQNKKDFPQGAKKGAAKVEKVQRIVRRDNFDSELEKF